MKKSFVVLSLLAATLAFGCERPSTTQPTQIISTPTPVASEPVIELKVYDVPANTGDRLRPILQRVLGDHGKVQQVPDGRLLVAAPGSVHDGLAGFFEEGKKLAPKARDTVKIEYWFVTGSLAKAGASKGADPRLAPITDALSTIEKSQGIGNFRLEEHISLAATDGEYALTRGEVKEINQTASVQGELVEAHVEISLAGDARELSTKLRVRQGQTVVLGQAGWGDIPGRDREDLLEQKPAETLFYVIRVTSMSP